MFDAITKFENQLSHYTGAKWAVMTDCCTHAIELCFIYNKVSKTSFTPYTYLSVLMLMHKLDIHYNLLDEPCQEWIGEYSFDNTNIWDSARRLERGMYRPGSMQCLSFGHSKPLEIGRGGAILLDDPTAYKALKEMSYDGRDLSISPWQDQKEFRVGYHYKPTIEEANIGSRLLTEIKEQSQFIKYPDLRNVRIVT
jgi:dTDP-4-amino-4,6-dideoxygalactose transaminase|tara:strand:- start:2290 stop:2877 length:588 start_codon:yes stop_codon:yes gene_type:complete